MSVTRDVERTNQHMVRVSLERSLLNVTDIFPHACSLLFLHPARSSKPEREEEEEYRMRANNNNTE